MRVGIYNNGVCLDMGRADRERVGGGKRGKLDGTFSAASFRRLREFCITHDVKGDCWGITLTIPGLDLVNQIYIKDIIHKLGVWANDNNIPVVWRVELQQRGQPHLHLVLYGSARDCVFCCLMWQKYIAKTGKCLSHEVLDDKTTDIVWINRIFVRGSAHAFDIQRLSGDFRAWRYLVAHASKGKQLQQGFRGRQWGVVCRSAFAVDSGLQYDLCDCEMYSVRRWVRRLTRRKIHATGKHYLLTDASTLVRMVEFARELYRQPL